jgi:hypothetical protein
MECTFVMDALVAYSFDRVDWMLTNPTALTKTATGLEGLPLAYTPTNDILTAMTFGTYPAFAFPRTPADSFTDEYQFSTNFSCRRGRTSSSSVCCTSAIISLLLGSLNSFTQTQYIAHKDAEYDDTDFYIQDTWKVKHNLTFDYGVRIYHMPSQHELDPAKTNDATFVPGLWTASQAVRLNVLDPKSPTQVIDPANPNSPLPASLTNILKYTIVPGSGKPRDGVAVFGANGIGNNGIINPNFLLAAPRGGFAWSRSPRSTGLNCASTRSIRSIRCGG